MCLFYLYILPGDYYTTTLPPQPPPRPPNLPSNETIYEELPTESIDKPLYETGESDLKDGSYESVDAVKEPYEYSRPFPRVAINESYMNMTKPIEVIYEKQYDEIGTARISDEVGQNLKGILHKGQYDAKLVYTNFDFI